MTAVAVMRHESELGTWTHAEWVPKPNSPLAGLIDLAWYFEGSLSAAFERVFPDGTLSLVVQLDEPHRPALRDAAPFPAACLSGMLTTAEVIEAPPSRCRVLGVRLTPHAAFAVVRAPLHDVTSLTVDLHALLGTASLELEAHVREARGGQEIVSAAVAWTARRITGGPQADSVVRRALDAIVADGGVASIAALDAWEGRSRARFAATFRDHVGVSPKRFARIVRFHRALRALADTRLSLGEIALAAGYYDQAHFASEFREHAGLTPRAYRRAAHFPGGTSLAAGADQNLQDTASSIAVDSSV